MSNMFNIWLANLVYIYLMSCQKYLLLMSVGFTLPINLRKNHHPIECNAQGPNMLGGGGVSLKGVVTKVEQIRAVLFSAVHYGAAHPSAHPEHPLVAGSEGGGTCYKVGYLMPDVVSEGGAEAALLCLRHLFMALDS